MTWASGNANKQRGPGRDPQVLNASANQRTIVSSDRHDAGSWHGRSSFWKMTSALFSRVLDAHEDRATIGTPGDSGDFAFARTDHESPDLAAMGIADQHLVVSHAGEISGVAVVPVGLDPQEPVRIEGNAVGRIEQVPFMDVF